MQNQKALAPHSSTLAWKIPWMEEPGRLQSKGSWRVRHDWATSISLFTFMHWRRKWQPTPVFLTGESQGQGSLVGFNLVGRRVGHDWSDLAAVAAAEPEGPKHMILEFFTSHFLYIVVFKHFFLKTHRKNRKVFKPQNHPQEVAIGPGNP